MDRTRRSFGAGDAAIVIGPAILAGLLFPSLYLSGRVHGWYTYLIPPGSAAFRLGWLYPIFAMPILIALGPALLALTLRQPRPPLRRLLRRPGATASVAATLGFLMSTVALIADMVTGQGPYEAWLDGTYPPIGLAVAGVWTVAAITGRWRPAPTWLDRLGRTMGWIWIATALAQLAKLASTSD